MSPYHQRLQSDWDALREALRDHPKIVIDGTAGTPPQRYHIRYRVKGLEEKFDGTLAGRDEHLVEITLPRSYPRTAPLCRMLTPLFHPNIAPHAICIGDHWAAGESLTRLVFRIGEMIAFQSYNTKSPLNGPAAQWAEEHLAQLPLDRSPLLPPDLDRRDGPAAVAVAETPAPPIVFPCPACGAKLSAEPRHAGKLVDCPRCGGRHAVPRS
jgi:ubiquitin-protein ligase